MRDSTRIGTVETLRMRVFSRTTTFELDCTEPPLLTLDCKHEVGKMAPYDCKVQFLDDTDPFNSTSFPEPSRPPTYTFLENLPLVNQISGLHKLLGAPHKIEDVALQLSHNGTYLDMESTLEEQGDELEGFKDSRKNTIILRTQLSVRVHNIIAKLLSATGRDLRRALFSLKQIFQDDKDLVHEFVTADGLSCLITVGTDADQNYQNYILRAIGQIMLYVDGMNGVIQHNDTIQWLYSLLSSKYRLVQKTSLKLLLVFVEYTENNSRLLWQAIQAVDTNRAAAPTRGLIDIMSESDSGTDEELLVYALTLVNKVLYATPDQDTFYDVTDALEELGMEVVMKKLLNRQPPNKDLTEQCNIYEASLKAEDGDENQGLYMAATGVRQRRSKGGKLDIDDGNRRRSRRHSAAKRMSDPSSAPDLRLLANGPRSLSDRVGGEDLSLNKQMSNSSPELDAKARRRQLRKERRMNRMSPLTNDSIEDSPKPEEESHQHLSRKTSLSRRERRERRQSRDSTEDKAPVKIYENGYPTSPAERKEFSPPVSPHSVDQRSPKISMRQRFDVDDAQPERKSLRDRIASSSSSNDAKTDLESSPMDRERNKKNAVEDQGTAQRKTSLDSSDSKRMMLRMFYGQSIDKGDSDTGGEGSSSSTGTVSSNHVSNKIETGETINDRKTNLAKNAVKPEEEDKKQLETINEMKGIVGAKQNVLTSKPQQEVAHSEPTKPSGDKTGLLSRMKNALTKQPEAHAESAQQTKAQEAARSAEDIELENRVLRSRPLKINEFDFTDLKEDDDDDVMSARGNLATGPPPPPPGFGVPPPPGGGPPPPPPGMPPQPPPPPGAPPPPPGLSGSKKEKDRKFVRLFWQEVRNLPSSGLSKTIWCNLEPVDVDTRKLEHLFENRVKSGTLRRADSEEKMAKKEIVVLELKRAQAINIVLTKLPPIRAIKQAILDMDSAVIDREGIEKITAMMPTEDEKTKIQEAQLQFPETPLAHAEHFLLTLASINELHARLNLWAFKLDYDNTEREIAEGLSDLKNTAEQLRKSGTFKRILGTLLAIGCFLNGVKIKGFNLDYLAKVPEVRDTVHKQSLLYHLCCMVMEKFPESSDLYSELGSVHRASRCDFDNILLLLKRLDESCRRSWEYLRLIAKHDSSSPLKTKLTEFLADAGERIAILKVVHRRVHNRFRKLLVYLGINARNAKETKPHEFCKIISEFSLEYRTVRQKVIEQKKKKENKRTRTKTRGKMITESENFTNATTAVPVNNKPETEVNMQAFHEALIGDGGRDSLKSASKSRLRAASTKTQQPASPVMSGSNAGGNYDTDDQTDQMMDMLVKSATSADKRTRIRKNRAKDSKSVRKSVRRTRTLKSGLTPEEVESLQLNATG